MSVALHQLVAAAAPGDAVTGQALAWRRVLNMEGVESDIYAEHIHPDMADDVLPLSALPGDTSPVLLRYSIWSEAAGVARRRRGPLGFLYHNITPGYLIGAANPMVAALCDRGRRELPTFRGRSDVVIADSSFNALELRSAGFPEPTVIPLMLDLPLPPPARNPVPPSMLFVGRVVPSKRIDDLLRVLALVRARHIPDATLDIIGADGDFPGYRRALDELATALELDDAVTFRGRVSDTERDDAYSEAGVYLSMSEHEGFCAPLLEAMSRGLPVVARAAGAVPETTGRAALLVPGRNPELAAQAVARVLADAEVRRGLAVNARRRLEELQPAAMTQRILDALDPLLAA